VKRIDLISKLIAPIFISTAAMALKSQVAMTLTIALMNLVLLLPELFFAKWVWSRCVKLQEPKQAAVEALKDIEDRETQSPLTERCKHWGSGLKGYFSQDVWRRMMLSSITLTLLLT
jgi:iron-regulated transporter 1